MANQDIIDDLLHCMICFEAYSNPKMLKCAHTFCEQCLQGYYFTYQQQKRAVPGKIPCPTCREQTTLPSNGVSGLRNDFKARKLEEMFRTVNFKQRAVSNLCDPCRSQKKSVQASVYCSACSMNYCKTCLQKHNRNPIFSKHQVMSKMEDSTSLFCKQHPAEQGRFFCITCQTVICTLCIMERHAEHNVEEVDVLFEEHKRNIALLRSRLEQRLESLELRARQLQAVRQLNLSSCQSAELDIQERTQQMIAALEKKRNDMLTELRQRRTRQLASIQEEMDEVNNQIAQAQNVQDFASNSVMQSYVRIMAVHEELSQRLRTVLDTGDVKTDSYRVLTFLPGYQEPDLGRVDDIQADPELLQRHQPANDNTPPSRSGSQRSSRNSPRNPSSLIRNPDRALPALVFHVNKHGSRRGELRDPLGVASLLSGDIVVSEWGNKRIQVFDSTGQSVAELGNDKIGPQGIAVTLRGNIIATDGRHKRIQVFSPSGKSLSIWGLGKFFAPCGIATSPNGNFVVTDSAEHAVNIYRGEKSCIARFGSRGSSNEHFHNPLYVATNQKSEIIVSDSDNHCIKMFDKKGNFIRHFGEEGSGDGQLKFPRGVTTDYQGNIIVADRNNARVSLFSSHGRFLRHLLTADQGIRDPYAVALTLAGNLAVTESAQDRSSVKVFQL